MYYCGIDVAKHKHAVAVLDEHGHAHKAVFSTENTRQGMETLLSELKPLGDICIGLEATGHYWLSLYDVLTKNGYPVSVINPMQISAYRKSGLRKVKNDRTDAVWIADFMRISNLPASSQNIPILLQLRELTRFWLLAFRTDRGLQTQTAHHTGSCISRIRNIILQCVRDFLTRTASGSDLCSGVCGFQFG
jgi:transposase